jgi:hypothetical protein
MAVLGRGAMGNYFAIFSNSLCYKIVQFETKRNTEFITYEQ